MTSGLEDPGFVTKKPVPVRTALLEILAIASKTTTADRCVGFDSLSDRLDAIARIARNQLASLAVEEGGGADAF